MATPARTAVSRLKLGALAVSRRLHFRGKQRLLGLVNLNVANKDVVPPDVDTVECIKGIRIATSCPRDVMFRELFVNGFYQDDVLVALDHLLEPGHVFWDIGANYGFMSIYVDRVFRGKVRSFAFEPSPVVLEELRRNLALNGCRSVSVEPVCLSDRVGEVSFYTSADHSWNATMIAEFAETHAETIALKVPSTTIDETVERIPPPDVIKLDVEGAEHLVLDGGRKYLASRKVPIIAEYNEQAIKDVGLTPDRYLALFGELGYRTHVLRRPVWGMHRWKTLHEISGPADLASLCNVILLKG